MNDHAQRALIREAGIAGNSISAGLAALRKANYAQVGLYSHAFFSLSIGLERFLKLLFIMDYCIETGKFPTNGELKNIGHDIEILFKHAQNMKEKYALHTDPAKIADSSIEMQIVLFMSRFAKTTRYFNLDLVTGKAVGLDPIADWFEKVGQPILKKHFTQRREAKVRQNAELIDLMVGRFSFVNHTAEDGTSLETTFSASYQTGMTEVIRKYGTFYSARLCRFLYYIIVELKHKCNAREIDIPCLDELFFPFMNNDAYLLSRKTFPPRGQ